MNLIIHHLRTKTIVPNITIYSVMSGSVLNQMHVIDLQIVLIVFVGGLGFGIIAWFH